MLKNFSKILLALILLASSAFAVFWISRPADVSFEETRFEKCGHLPQEEMPERFVEEAWKFIEQSSRTKS